MAQISLPTAREYLRVSFDTSGRERSNDEQHNDNVIAAETLGVTLGDPYRDVGSASRKSSKCRDGFEALLEDLTAGRFGADMLVLWESSRGSRRVGEWVTLIDLCELKKVRIMVTTHGPRVYDPANPRDRRSLLEDAVDSEYEAAKLSVRVTRAAAANAVAGKPHGPAPYGYMRIYDTIDRHKFEQVPHPTEAPIILEAFGRVAAGNSLRSVATDLAERGVVGRRGAPMSAATLRPMLLSETYIGRRVHAPGSASRSTRQRHGKDVHVTEGTWEALVPTELFLAVRQRLLDPARRTSRPGRGVHLLSMIARCDVCSEPIVATYRHQGRRQYQCRGVGHIRIDADPLDEHAEAAMLTFLARGDAAEALLDDDTDDEALVEARQDLARARRDIAELAEQVGRGVDNGGISAMLAAAAEPAIQARLTEATRRVDELATPSSLRGLIDPAGDIAAQWKAAEMSVKREIARLLLAPGQLGELRIRRSAVRGGSPVAPVADRVVWRS